MDYTKIFKKIAQLLDVKYRNVVCFFACMMSTLLIAVPAWIGFESLNVGVVVGISFTAGLSIGRGYENNRAYGSKLKLIDIGADGFGALAGVLVLTVVQLIINL